MPEVLSNFTQNNNIVKNLIECINFEKVKNVYSSFCNIGITDFSDSENYQLLINEYNIPLKKIALNYLDTIDFNKLNNSEKTFFTNLKKNNIKKLNFLQIAQKLYKHDKRKLSKNNCLQILMLRDHYLFCNLVTTILQKLVKDKTTITDTIKNIALYNNSNQLSKYLCFINILYISYIFNIEDFLHNINIETLIKVNICINKILIFIQKQCEIPNSSLKILEINIGNIKSLQNKINQFIINTNEKKINYYCNLYNMNFYKTNILEILNTQTEIENLQNNTNNIYFTVLTTKFLNYYNFFLKTILQFTLDITNVEKSLKICFLDFLESVNNTNISQNTKNIINIFIHAIIVQEGIKKSNIFFKSINKKHSNIKNYIKEFCCSKEFFIHCFADSLDNVVLYKKKDYLEINQQINIKKIINKYLTSCYNALDYGRSFICMQKCLKPISVIYRSSNTDREIINYPTDTNGLLLWLSSKNYKTIHKASDIWNFEKNTLENNNFFTCFDITVLQNKFINFINTIADKIHCLNSLWEYANNLFIYATTNKREKNQILSLELYQFSLQSIKNLINIYTSKNTSVDSLIKQHLFFDIACSCQYNKNFVDQINFLIFENLQTVNEEFYNNIIELSEKRKNISDILEKTNVDLQKNIEKIEKIVRNCICVLNLLDFFNSDKSQKISKEYLQKINTDCENIILDCTKHLTNNINEFLRIIKLEIPGELIKVLYQTQKKQSFLKTIKKQISQIQKKLQPEIGYYLLLEFIQLKARITNLSNYKYHRNECLYNENNYFFQEQHKKIISTLSNNFLNKIILTIQSLQCGYFSLYEQQILNLTKNIFNNNSITDFKNLIKKLLYIKNNSISEQNACTVDFDFFLNKFCTNNLSLFIQKLDKDFEMIKQNSFETIFCKIGEQEGLITFISDRIRNLTIQNVCFPIFQLQHYIDTIKDKVTKEQIQNLNSIVKQNCPDYFLPNALEIDKYSIYYSFKESIEQLKQILALLAKTYIVNNNTFLPRKKQFDTIITNIQQQKQQNKTEIIQKQKVTKIDFEKKSLTVEGLKNHIQNFSDNNIFKIVKNNQQFLQQKTDIENTEIIFIPQNTNQTTKEKDSLYSCIQQFNNQFINYLDNTNTLLKQQKVKKKSSKKIQSKHFFQKQQKNIFTKQNIGVLNEKDKKVVLSNKYLIKKQNKNIENICQQIKNYNMSLQNNCFFKTKKSNSKNYRLQKNHLDKTYNKKNKTNIIANNLNNFKTFEKNINNNLQTPHKTKTIKQKCLAKNNFCEKTQKQTKNIKKIYNNNYLENIFVFITSPTIIIIFILISSIIFLHFIKKYTFVLLNINNKYYRLLYGFINKIFNKFNYLRFF